MPLNTLRLNHAPSSHPNERIVFIKPLPRPPQQSSDYEIANNLLRAIAAQCLPIMKSNYLSVTTLEEHEPNPEFIGRNFNNGEIIQLVLRGRSGNWLPVNTIQMVMMHELAHNLHMNHGKNFWKARNQFAGEMKTLWVKGYTGEGLWGNGRTLNELGNAMGHNIVRSEELKHLPVCGGTFRSRRRKRKTKSDGLTWREKKDRRIEKKFGKNGVALGEDEDKRLSLEITGKGPMGVKPRVAQSKRGRELRAAAALARFDTNKREVEDLERCKEEETQSETESEYEDIDIGQEDAKDTDGQRFLDSKGNSMVKVCGGEDTDDDNVKREMEDLDYLDLGSIPAIYRNDIQHPKSGNPLKPPKPNSKPASLYDIPRHQDTSPPPTPSNNLVGARNQTNHGTSANVDSSRASKSSNRTKSHHDIPQHHGKSLSTKPSASTSQADHAARTAINAPEPATPNTPTTTSLPNQPNPPLSPSTSSTSQPTQPTTTIPDRTGPTCPICSLLNQPYSVTCAACSHVLDRRKDPRFWSCSSDTCQGTEYINAGDVAVCGICGGRRQ